MDYVEKLVKAIERGTVNKKLDKAIKDARFGKAVYTGIDQEYILNEYRKKETKAQREQRNRITTTRTKHTANQIGNVIDQLELMSKPAINVIVEGNEEAEKSLLQFINEDNISDMAFNYTKYYNMTDANAYLTCGINEDDEVEYKAVGVNNLYDYRMVNKQLKFVIFVSDRKVKEETVKDYTLYAKHQMIQMRNVKGLTSEEGSETRTIKSETYRFNNVETSINFAFPLGFIEDMTNNQETCLTIMDAASELLKGLIWQGSEMDCIDATQGIIKQFAYARRCGYSFKASNDEHYKCVGGTYHKNGAPTNEKCAKCSGGLEVHTSSQDIIYFPMPKQGQEFKDLSKLIHTEFIPTNILDYKKQHIKAIKEEIIKTVFNSSMVSKDDLARTATEKTIDLQGIYAVLNQIGKQVTKTFTWMVRCASYLKHETDCTVIHGYTLNLKLEDLQSLAKKRKDLIEANAPSVLLKSIDMAMIEKQHLSSPVFIARYAAWESFRPFSGKSPSEIQQILSTLPDLHSEKILYNFFDKIKANINREQEDLFYDGNIAVQKEIIDDEIEKLREEFKALAENDRVVFD